jgi:hypothetical protein
MVNASLAVVAALVWGATYSWFFAREIRRWWRSRGRRRAEAEARRERAIAAYAEWVRDIPPPRPRRAILPPVPVPTPAAAPARHGGIVVPFPGARRRANEG